MQSLFPLAGETEIVGSVAGSADCTHLLSIFMLQTVQVLCWVSKLKFACIPHKGNKERAGYLNLVGGMQIIATFCCLHVLGNSL